MRMLNLGIVAHVDAGKTSLTERLLYAAGVIDAVGSVDQGSTQTDTLTLERERGITIKSAVVSFVVDDLRVNLIDTPGHPDFIAEVDRVLGLLDGAILVVSAVEGVQAQTRVLMRALRRLAIPTLIFVNKIDRMGADVERVFEAIRDKLTPSPLALGWVENVGARDASHHPFETTDMTFVDSLAATIAEHDDDVLTRYVLGEQDSVADLDQRLERLTGRGLIHPVVFGSAITGAGVAALTGELVRLLPAGEPAADQVASGIVFKIHRADNGERTALVRMFAGELHTRDRITVRGEERRITKIAVFERGGEVERDQTVGGEIARLSGLGRIRIGDVIGQPRPGPTHHFSPPPFEAVVSTPRPSDRGALRTALDALAEEDPLINLRQNEARGELSVSLYGEVQVEVIRDTLLNEFGLAVEFGTPTTVCVERLIGSGEATEIMLRRRTALTPFLAGVGLRVEPAPLGTGVVFSPSTQLGRLPLAFVNAVEEAVLLGLGQGLFGWEISDCRVTMIASGYFPRQSHAHATFDKKMSSIASDFRQLTPLVLMAALRSAGTTVLEPVHRFHLEAPADSLAPVVRLLVGLHAIPETPVMQGQSFGLSGLIPAAELGEFRRRLPALTSGEGFVDSRFDSYGPVRGQPPSRERTHPDPLDRTAYLRYYTGRG
jgi:ribosomal protection tetracycline resistance protein